MLQKKAKGLTLIELITVVAIIAIITAVGWSWYEGSKMRGYRSDGIIALTQARAFMEKCYSNYRNYNHLQCGAGTLPASAYDPITRGTYNISVTTSSADPDVYTLTATATGTQADDDDCDVIEITNTGDKSGSTNTFCWPQ